MNDPSRRFVGGLDRPTLRRWAVRSGRQVVITLAATAALVGAAPEIVGTLPLLAGALATRRPTREGVWIAALSIAIGAALGLPVELGAIVAAGALAAERTGVGFLVGLGCAALAAQAAPALQAGWPAAVWLMACATVPALSDLIAVNVTDRAPTPREATNRLGPPYSRASIQAWEVLAVVPPTVATALTPLAARVYRLGHDATVLDRALRAVRPAEDRPDPACAALAAEHAALLATRARVLADLRHAAALALAERLPPTDTGYTS
jgi:hypothetical protein